MRPRARTRRSRGNDKIIATGNLGLGAQTHDGCSFPFTVKAVPFAKFYAVEVGHRGKITFTPAQLKEKNWAIVLTLG